MAPVAEHVAESLDKGTRVILTGRLRQRSYEAQDGGKRTVYEIEADEIGPSLRNATAKVEKVTRANGAEIAQPPANGPASTRTTPTNRRSSPARRDARPGPSPAGRALSRAPRSISFHYFHFIIFVTSRDEMI